MASQDLPAGNLYCGLHFTKDEPSIRVLDILPGKWESGLEGILRTVSLASDPSYEALSYTWGESSDNKVISVDGFDVPITNNLFNALRRLRRRCKPRTVWADAICINQRNNSERSEQVALMGTIYSKAACVNIWLGEPRLEPPRTLKWSFVSQVWRVLTTSLIYWLWWYQEYEKRTAPGPVSEGIRALASFLLQDAVAMNSAIENTSPRWYDRAWVVQEFMQAKQVYLYYGRRRSLHSSSWLCALESSLELSVERRAQQSRPSEPSDDHSAIFPPEYRYIRQLQTFMKDVLKLGNRERNTELRSRIPLTDALDIIRNTRATDPRDKIYSVLDLIDEREKELIGCNYSIAYAEVYSRATYASCKSRGDLLVLNWVAIDGNRFSGLPSWTVDFNNLGNLPWRSYQPFFDGLEYLTTDVSISGSNRHLTLFANRFDTVSHSMELPRVFGRPPQLSDTDHTQLAFFLDRAAKAFMLSLDGYRGLTNSERAASTLLHRILDTSPDSAFYPTIEDLLIPDPLNSLLGYSRQSEDIFRRWESLPAIQCRARPEFRRQPGVMKDIDDFLEESVVWAALDRWSQTTRYTVRQQDHVVRYMGLFLDYTYFAASAPVLFSTRNGAVGVAPCSLAANDILVLCRNHCQFLVLRPDGNYYKFRGLAYVQFFQDREFWNRCDSSILKPEPFVLI